MSIKASEQDWIERIKSAYIARDYPQVNRLMKQALVETDLSPSLLEIAGIMAFERGEYEESIRLIETAMIEICLSISGQLTLAKAWVEVGNYDAAETTLVFLVELINRVPCAMLPDLTRTVVQIGRDDLAIEICKTVLARHPYNDKAAYGVGFYLLRSEGELSLAKAYMRRAVTLNPKCWMYRVSLAIICVALGEWDSAYSQATKIPVSEIKQLPCECLVSQIKEIFLHFEDFERLADMGTEQ